MQLAFFWTRSAYTESMSVRGFPTIPCAVLTAQAKCFLSCFVQLPYYTDILRQRMLSAVVLQKFAAGSRGAHPIYGSWGKAAFAGPSLPGDMYSSCDVQAVMWMPTNIRLFIYSTSSPCTRRGACYVLSTPCSHPTMSLLVMLVFRTRLFGHPLRNEPHHHLIWDPVQWCCLQNSQSYL